MVATKKRVGRPKTKKSRSLKSNGVNKLTGARLKQCRSSFSRKCNSEFLTDAYHFIKKSEGLKGKTGGFSQAQCKRALSMASKAKKGVKFSTAYKNRINKGRKHKGRK